MVEASKQVGIDLPETKSRRFGLIVIGDEILSGRRQAKHLSKLIELLNERGLSLSWAKYVADDPEQITATLKDSFAVAMSFLVPVVLVPLLTTILGSVLLWPSELKPSCIQRRRN